MDSYERVLLVKPEVFVYKIPPRTTNRGYRAADWNLQAPDWTGRMRLVNVDKDCIMKLEDKNSGELFAKCMIDQYPGSAVESVLDSSRYFVIKIQDDNGRSAFIGIGFADRGDSFDLNVALQDHFKWIQKTEEIAAEESKPDSKPQLDLGFKEGQTIKINMNIVSKGQAKPRTKSAGVAGGSILLPPPPGGVKIAAPPSSSLNSQKSSTASAPSDPTAPSSTATSVSDDLLGLDGLSSNTKTSSQGWNDFAGENSNNQQQSTENGSGAGGGGGAWIQF